MLVLLPLKVNLMVKINFSKIITLYFNCMLNIKINKNFINFISCTVVIIVNSTLFLQFLLDVNFINVANLIKMFGNKKKIRIIYQLLHCNREKGTEIHNSNNFIVKIS